MRGAGFLSGVLLCGGLVLAGPLRAAADDGALRERIRGMIEPVRDVPLPLLIEALSGHEVLPWREQRGAELEAVARAVRDSINRGGITSARMNEAGNLVERHVLAALTANGFAAGRAIAPSGRARTAGYPDLEARAGEDAFYIEVKVYGPDTTDSTQRSFYLSPSADFKVVRDAHHLLIAVELFTVAKGLHRARTVRWLDLSGLRCDLKYEFNASNRDLYSPEAGLVIRSFDAVRE